uniref:Uncharacterized protein n=1 Tax=Guillardia theta TaxID=55529 RepID=A0A7S4PA55_GUITH|mmetsp:Transcript_46311/g.145299  ORF Transcript_46311/g.145299 Transcript_46311/m.145299 type:complete len:145 (+) Transcript_46311:78-512(+)
MFPVMMLLKNSASGRRLVVHKDSAPLMMSFHARRIFAWLLRLIVQLSTFLCKKSTNQTPCELHCDQKKKSVESQKEELMRLYMDAKHAGFVVETCPPETATDVARRRFREIVSTGKLMSSARRSQRSSMHVERRLQYEVFSRQY